MRNNITYHKEGDYLISNLTIENDNKNYHIGKYGHLRLKYLKEHKRGFYTELMMIGQLANHLSDVDEVATKMVSDTIKKLAKQEGINEELKATNQLGWVQAMNNIKNRIEEIVFKELTNFENTKKLVESITYDIPEETDIKDLKKFMFNKNEKILNDVIKPKEEIIKELAIENKSLKKELSKQSKIVNEATKYQKERDSIIADNRALHNKVDNLENEYKKKSSTLEWEYENKYNKLEKENNRLYKIIDRFYTTIEKFIECICNRFNFGESKKLIRNFEKETNTFIDPVKQITKVNSFMRNFIVFIFR